jgi:predicted nucleotide-binding protein
MSLHVLLFVQGAARPVIVWDIDEQDLVARILRPYATRKRIVVVGAALEADAVTRVQIVSTDTASREFLPQTKAFAARGHDEWFRAEGGRDVTDAYLDTLTVTENVDPEVDPRNVFVVHGRNARLRDAMFTFLGALDLRPMEWADLVIAAGQPTPFIDEVLKQGFARAAAFVVLLTGDDVAMLREPLRKPDEEPHETTLTAQARPNVLFEAGLALAYAEKRTILVQVGKLRPFSDIAGRHTVTLTNEYAPRQDFALRLKAAGCAVRMSGTYWHRAGDFLEDPS